MTHSDTPRIHGLSTSETRWLVGEAQRVIADLGHDATVLDGVALTLDDDRVLGLDNLARTLARLPRRDWAGVIRAQMTALMTLDPTTPVSPADLRPKLWPRERAHDFLDYEPLEPLPGVVAVLATQGDGTTREFGRLDQVGDRDEAYATALANLASLPLPRHTQRRLDPHARDSWVHHLEAPDPFGAARVLALPEMMRRVLRRPFPPAGVLVAVPTKHDLWVHLPAEETVVDTTLLMAYRSWCTWAEHPYPISPMSSSSPPTCMPGGWQRPTARASTSTARPSSTSSGGSATTRNARPDSSHTKWSAVTGSARTRMPVAL